jgi:hypothetical protein
VQERTSGPKGLISPGLCGTAEAVPFVPGLRSETPRHAGAGWGTLRASSLNGWSVLSGFEGSCYLSR